MKVIQMKVTKGEFEKDGFYMRQGCPSAYGKGRERRGKGRERSPTFLGEGKGTFPCFFRGREGNVPLLF